MYKKSFLQPILLGFIAIFFASCDKDFNELGTDIVGDDHFGFEVDTFSTVKAYNQKLGPIASNNLPLSPLGFYHNPAFGDVQANYVTQIELSALNQKFNNTDTEDYVNLPVVDSVVLDIPYYKKFLDKDATNDSISLYRLDSIYGPKPGLSDLTTKFKLSVYQSNYFLRDLDPNLSLAEMQTFYTDENNTIDNNKINVLLNDAPLLNVPGGIKNADGHENENFYFNKNEHKLTTFKDDGVAIYTRYPPSMRLHLKSSVFYDKIINASTGLLESQAAFKNYFRGIYFKVENGNPGNMAMLNFKAGKITMYYKEDKITKDNATTPDVNEYKLDRISKVFALNLNGNCVSLLHHSNENVNYLNAANSSQEASKIYLKGGEGSMSIVDLFGSIDTKGYILNPSYNENLPINLTTNAKYLLVAGANGISDEIDDIKFNGWLINEANLTFYVDKAAMSDPQTFEPNRIYLYDLTNKKPIIDYIVDLSTNGLYPKFNKSVFGGYLSDNKGLLVKQIRNDVTGVISAKGTKYKLRITNYVRNLVKNDSTNVRLGLSVTENINIVGLAKLRTPNSNVTSAPAMSVLSPLGTILYGSDIPVTDGKYKYRLKLEIYYTKPN